MLRKRFGQHLLTDRGALRRIVDALGLGGDDTVIEIGPGKGALTDLLVEHCRRLACVEIDRDLAAFLRDRYRQRAHVQIVTGDALDVNLGALAGGPFVLVGNLPYYVTTPLIFHALRKPRPERAVFLVQREVAERLGAAPGTQEYGALSVNVQLVATVEVLGRVGPAAFVPRPTVDSAIVRLRPHAGGLLDGLDEDQVRGFVIGLFGQRRRQIVRALRTVSRLDAESALRVVTAAGLDPTVRPETLTPAEFVALFRALAPRRA